MNKLFANYYHNYLNSFLDFLVPKNKKALALKFESKGEPSGDYDYLVISDALGYVYDIQKYFTEIQKYLNDNGRVVITQYSSLWEPVLRLASMFGLRSTLRIEQNWLSINDIKNFAHLANLDVIKFGSKMIMPIYIPILSSFLNKYIANIFPFSRMGLFHYVVLRKNITKSYSDKKSLPSISIVVPARNEAGTIEKIAKDLPNLGSFTEIIFIEGNSTDNTYNEIVRVAEKYKNIKKIKYGRQDGKGKGDAVRKGFDMATGDILTIFDADMTVPAPEMKKFYDAIVQNKGDFINGCRLIYPLQKESMRVLNIFGNKFFSLAFSAILDQRLKDTLCGTKVIWRKDYDDVIANRKFFGNFDPFGDFDLLFGAAKLNLKIIDLPIHYQERTYGTTNISRWKHGWLLLKMTVFAARKIKFI